MPAFIGFLDGIGGTGVIRGCGGKKGDGGKGNRFHVVRGFHHFIPWKFLGILPDTVTFPRIADPAQDLKVIQYRWTAFRYRVDMVNLRIILGTAFLAAAIVPTHNFSAEVVRNRAAATRPIQSRAARNVVFPRLLSFYVIGKQAKYTRHLLR